MSSTARRWFAAIAILGFAAASVGIGVSLSSAQEAKAPDLTGLRESVAAAGQPASRTPGPPAPRVPQPVVAACGGGPAPGQRE